MNGDITNYGIHKGCEATQTTGGPQLVTNGSQTCRGDIVASVFLKLPIWRFPFRHDGVPLVIIHFDGMVLFTKTNQLLGYPHGAVKFMCCTCAKGALFVVPVDDSGSRSLDFCFQQRSAIRAARGYTSPKPCGSEEEKSRRKVQTYAEATRNTDHERHTTLRGFQIMNGFPLPYETFLERSTVDLKR